MIGPVVRAVRPLGGHWFAAQAWDALGIGSAVEGALEVADPLLAHQALRDMTLDRIEGRRTPMSGPIAELWVHLEDTRFSHSLQDVAFAAVARRLDLNVTTVFVDTVGGAAGLFAVAPNGLPIHVFSSRQEGDAWSWPGRRVLIRETLPARTRELWLAATSLQTGDARSRRALSYPGRYRTSAQGFRTKEVQPEASRSDTRRWILLHDLVAAEAARSEREELLAILQARLNRSGQGADRRELRCVADSERLEGKTLLATNTLDLSPEDIASAYLSVVRTRSEFLPPPGRTRAGPADNVISWFSLLLVRATECLGGQLWPRIRAQLSSLHEVMLETRHGATTTTSPLHSDQVALCRSLGIDGPSPHAGRAPADGVVEPEVPPHWKPPPADLDPDRQQMRRRAPGEGREVLLAAARELFSERHYSGTSAREIAERAGIAETLLFRNFGSKSALFAEAVLGPIREFARTWEAFQSGVAEWSEEEIGQKFVEWFYDVLRVNRRLIISYIATSAVEPEILPLEEAPVFVDTVGALVEWSERALALRPETRVDPAIASRAAVGMILSMAIFDDWLGTGEARPPRSEVVEEMVHLFRFGITRQKLSLPAHRCRTG